MDFDKVELTNKSDDEFDQIFMIDEEFIKRGYENGIVQGTQAGMTDGMLTGVTNGKKAGEKIGHFYGFSMFLMCSLEQKAVLSKQEGKALKLLRSIVESAKRIVEVAHPDCMDSLILMKQQFKRVCQYLQIKQKLIIDDVTKQNDELSF